MLTTVEATIGTNGDIHLVESLHLAHSCRAIVTIMEEPDAPETALLSPSMGALLKALSLFTKHSKQMANNTRIRPDSSLRGVGD